MTLYKEEKKRIGSMRWGLVMGILFFFCLSLQGQMVEISFLKERGMTLHPIYYNLDFLLLGSFILIAYLNEKLFYIKERGKTVYLIKKYEILPIRVKTFYMVKLGIMAETILTLIAATIPIYFLVLAANHHFMVDPDMVGKMLIILIFSFVLTAVTVLFIALKNVILGKK